MSHVDIAFMQNIDIESYHEKSIIDMNSSTVASIDAIGFLSQAI